jgi:hypothetical protein
MRLNLSVEVCVDGYKILGEKKLPEPWGHSVVGNTCVSCVHAGPIRQIDI